jgi:hypothetical protein
MKNLNSNNLKLGLVFLVVVLVIGFSLMNSKSGKLSKVTNIPRDNLTASVIIPTQGLTSHYAMNVSGTTLQDDYGSNIGTIYGATVGEGKEGGGLNFNGSSYVDLTGAASSFNLQEMTVSAWINPSNNNTRFDFISKHGGTGATSSGWALYRNASNNRMYWSVAEAGNWRSLLGNTPVTSGNWYFITGVFSNSGNFQKLYINGEEDASNNSATWDVNYNVPIDPTFGSNADNVSEFFKGKLDEVSIYNRAFSASEVQTLYNLYTNTQPPAPNCHAVNSFSDLRAHGMGDANNNGVLDAADKTYLMGYIAGINPTCGAPAANNCFCDINANGSISIQDATFLNVYVVNSQGQYRLAVSQGTGGGMFSAGQSILIQANNPPTGKQFKEWTGTGANYLADKFISNTTLTMPSSNIGVTATYENISTETVAMPTASPAGGIYSTTQMVALSTATSGATIHYTTDGQIPTVNSMLYNGPITVSETKTIRAIAIKTGFANSVVMTEVYTISSEDPLAAYYALVNLNNYPTKIYVDPTHTGFENGTINSPYNSWSDFSVQSNTAYLTKRGTTLNFGGVKETTAGKQNILFGTYGTGEKPLILGGLKFTNCKNITVMDLYLRNPGSISQGILFSKSNELFSSAPENLLFLGNRLEGFPIYVTNFKYVEGLSGGAEHGPLRDVKIIGNDVGPVGGDGIAVNTSGGLANTDDYLLNFEIAYNYVHEVNQDWHTFANFLLQNVPFQYTRGGVTRTYNVVNHSLYCPITEMSYTHCPDGHTAGNVPDTNAVDCEPQYIPFTCDGDVLHLDDVYELWIHDNVLKKEDTGIKFNTILAMTTGDINNYYTNPIIENNTFIGPMTEGGGGTSLIIYGSRGDIIVRNNKFLPPHNYGTYVSTPNSSIKIYGNIYVGGNYGIGISYPPANKNTDIFNNVFHHVSGYDLEYIGVSGPGTIMNNVFSYLSGKSTASIMNVPNGYSGGYNLFSNQYSGMFANTGNPSYSYKSTDKTGNPMFVDPANNNFHLLSNSPARNAGTYLNNLGRTVDPDGTLIPQENVTDIGVYEYIPSLSRIWNFVKQIWS